MSTSMSTAITRTNYRQNSHDRSPVTEPSSHDNIVRPDIEPRLLNEVAVTLLAMSCKLSYNPTMEWNFL